MNNIAPGGGRFNGLEAYQAVSSKADQAIDKASNFKLLGLRIPKGPFKNKKAIERIEKSREMADQMLQEAIQALGKVMRPRS